MHHHHHIKIICHFCTLLKWNMELTCCYHGGNMLWLWAYTFFIFSMSLHKWQIFILRSTKFKVLGGRVISTKNKNIYHNQGCGAVTFLVGSGSGSGSGEAIRLRLQLRLRVKLFCGSGSGSGSGQNVPDPAAPAPAPAPMIKSSYVP